MGLSRTSRRRQVEDSRECQQCGAWFGKVEQANGHKNKHRRDTLVYVVGSRTVAEDGRVVRDYRLRKEGVIGVVVRIGPRLPSGPTNAAWADEFRRFGDADVRRRSLPVSQSESGVGVLREQCERLVGEPWAP